MCGRYFLVSDADALQAVLGVTRFPAESLTPRYNIAPLQRVPVIVSHQGERVLGLVRWGLTPVMSLGCPKRLRPNLCRRPSRPLLPLLWEPYCR